MNLGYAERERSMHKPAVNADMIKLRLFAVPPGSKSIAWV
jgi:hypothetical protein